MPRGPAAPGRARLDGPSRLLVANQFGANLGFFMVVPFLAAYLTDDVGLTVALAGSLLGLRVLSQQGLFLIGGTLADRVGARPCILAGCALRVAGFALYAASATLVAAVAATLLVGISGALFVPALRAYLSARAGPHRSGTFAVLESVGQVGALVGPLVGTALVAYDFRLVCLVASVVFAVLTLVQLVFLPAVAPAPRSRGVLAEWALLVRRGRLVALVGCSAVYLALQNQLYLALPLEAERVTGRPAATGAVFVTVTLLAVVAPVPLTSWLRRRTTAGRGLAVGLAAMGLAFAPVAVSTTLLATATRPLPPGGSARALAALLAGSVLLGLGLAVCGPLLMDLLVSVGGTERVGTSYGAFGLAGAVLTTATNAGVGALLDVGGPTARASAYAVLVALGLVGAAGVAVSQRRRRSPHVGGPAADGGL